MVIAIANAIAIVCVGAFLAIAIFMPIAIL